MEFSIDYNRIMSRVGCLLNDTQFILLTKKVAGPVGFEPTTPGSEVF